MLNKTVTPPIFNPNKTSLPHCVFHSTYIRHNFFFPTIRLRECKTDWIGRVIPMEGQLQKKLVIYVNDTDGKGSYPFRRAQIIARSLPSHVDIQFIIHENNKKRLSHTFKTTSISNSSQLIPLMEKLKPDLLLRDSGSSAQDEVEKLTKIVPAIIHFDDFGEGGKLTNLVIQTLYTDSNERPLEHFVTGIETFIADEQTAELKHLGLTRKVNRPLPHLVIFFGEEDTSNLTFRALRHMLQLQIPLKVTTVIGHNYDHDITQLKIMALGRRNTVILPEPSNLAEFLSTADIVLCSSGYLPYEIGVIGIPCVILAQNDFELSLAFPKEQHGFIHLGAGRKVKQSSLLNAVMELLLHNHLRKKAISQQVALNLGGGKNRIVEAILYYLEHSPIDGRNDSRFDMV